MLFWSTVNRIERIATGSKGQLVVAGAMDVDMDPESEYQRSTKLTSSFVPTPEGPEADVSVNGQPAAVEHGHANESAAELDGGVSENMEVDEDDEDDEVACRLPKYCSSRETFSADDIRRASPPTPDPREPCPDGRARYRAELRLV